MEINSANLIRKAKEGDKEALELLVKSVQTRIYRFSLKMLYNVSDAEDATQEILIKIITKLDSFREESSFQTWAMTIAANHLKNRKQNQKERWYSFKRCEEAILSHVPDDSSLNYSAAEQDLIVEEMRISCMQALLQCLDRDHRLVYILGTSIDISSTEGAEVLSISDSAYRKRLSRARKSIRDFLVKHCDLFNPENSCNCRKQTISAVSRGNIDPENLIFAKKETCTESLINIENELANLDDLARETAMMKINQSYDPSFDFVQEIRSILESRIN